MTINFDDFKKIEIKIGEIKSAIKVSGADMLLKLEVDFGIKHNPIHNITSTIVPNTSHIEERDVRQIISGIALSFPNPGILIGKKCAFAVNLEPRKVRGFLSNGMILAVGEPGGVFSLLEVNKDIVPGSSVK